MSEAGSFWQHVVQASLPVLKICILGSVGALLAACGVLDQQGRRTLSKLIYFLFTPCLTFSKLAPVLTAQHLFLWMPIAVNMFLSVGVGLVLGVALLLMVGAPAWFRKHVIVSTALGNAGNLPLVLVAALLQESGGVLFKDQDVSVDLSIAYVAMGIWAATITHFTVGTHLLKLPAKQERSASRSSQSFRNSYDKSAADYRTVAVTAHDQQQHQCHQKECHDGAWQGKSQGSISRGAGVATGSELCEGVSICSVELMSPASFTGKDLCHVQQQQQQQQQQQRGKGQEQTQRQALIEAVPPAVQNLEHGNSPIVLDAPMLVQQQEQRRHQQKAESTWRTWSNGISNLLSKPLSLPQHQQRGLSNSDLEHGEFARLLSSSQYSTSSSSNGVVGDQSAGSASLLQQQSQRQNSLVLQPSVPAHLCQPQQQQQHGTGSIVSGKSYNFRSSSSLFAGFATYLQGATVAGGKVFWAQCSPPMVGCMLAVVVGMTAAVRDQLFEPGGHLRMLQDCINMFSDCCIPCLLLMMGATLSKGPGKSCPPWRVVVGVSAARLVMMPLLGTAWIVLAQKAGWLFAPDSMFLLVMLIQNAVPTALNVHTLATLHGNKEEEVGALLFWQYLAACITVPAALMFFLWLLKTPTMAV